MGGINASMFWCRRRTLQVVSVQLVSSSRDVQGTFTASGRLRTIQFGKFFPNWYPVWKELSKHYPNAWLFGWGVVFYTL